MKEFYKKPEFYYCIAPAAVIVWILTIAFLTLSTAESKFEKAVEDRDNIQRYVKTILLIDGDRLKYEKLVEKTGKFDYAVEFEKFRKMHGITSLDLTSPGPMIRREQLIQSADIKIEAIDVERFSKFLSSIQQSWPNLQCETLSLTKKKNALDLWDAKLKFTYIFKK